MALRLQDLARRAHFERVAGGRADARGGGVEEAVGRLVEVQVCLVLLMLVEIDGAGGADGGEAERDRDDYVQPALPLGGWRAALGGRVRLLGLDWSAGHARSSISAGDAGARRVIACSDGESGRPAH